VIELNGQPFRTGPGHTLSKVLEELGLPDDGCGIAVAVDGTVVPRAEWPRFVLRDGASLELVRAVQGG